MGITSRTKLLGLFADPAEHSKSPKVFNAIFEKYGLDYAYLAFRIPEGRIGEAINAVRLFGMKGVNISMPHKEAVLPYLDEISDEARFCGAVNTVVNDNGVLKGYNTDIYGAVKAIENMNVDIKGSDIAIMGLGGAGKAVLTGISEKNPHSIKVFVRGRDALFNKTEGNTHHSAEALDFIKSIQARDSVDIELLDIENMAVLKETLADIDLLINATGVGMGDSKGESLIPDASYLQNKPAVLDVIYSPEKTRLLELADEAGCRFSNGLNMLMYQGEVAFKLLIDKDVSIADVFDAMSD